MNLFIESPERAAERGAWPRQGRDALRSARAPQDSHGRKLDLDEPSPKVPAVSGEAAGAPGVPYSQAQQSYREELAYSKKRTRQRKRRAVLRVLVYLVLLPVLLVIVFLAAYAVTCVLNGASPEEVVELLGTLLARLEGFLRDAFRQMIN